MWWGHTCDLPWYIKFSERGSLVFVCFFCFLVFFFFVSVNNELWSKNLKDFPAILDSYLLLLKRLQKGSGETRKDDGLRCVKSERAA